MDVAEPEEKTESAERFDILAQQRISLSTSVEKFICDAATKLNERVMEDLNRVSGSRDRRSVKSRSHRSSRHSSGTYSSKAQTGRLEAEKAQLALAFAVLCCACCAVLFYAVPAVLCCAVQCCAGFALL